MYFLHARLFDNRSPWVSERSMKYQQKDGIFLPPHPPLAVPRHSIRSEALSVVLPLADEAPAGGAPEPSQQWLANFHCSLSAVPHVLLAVPAFLPGSRHGPPQPSDPLPRFAHPASHVLLQRPPLSHSYPVSLHLVALR